MRMIAKYINGVDNPDLMSLHSFLTAEE